MIIRYLYILFLGILLSLFVGVGIAAFYQAPKPPTPMMTPAVTSPPNGIMTPEQSQKLAQQEAQQRKMFADYDVKSKNYNRNVSIIALLFSVLFVGVSLTVFTKMLVLSDGFLLGGLCTLIYSIITGFNSQNTLFQFFVVTAALLIVLFLGYKKLLFVTQTSKKK